MVEGHHLCETSNLCEAVLCLVASFFIFQISYPKSCCETLIAFEKLYLEVDESEIDNDWTNKIIKFYKEKAVSTKKKIVT